MELSKVKGSDIFDLYETQGRDTKAMKELLSKAVDAAPIERREEPSRSPAIFKPFPVDCLPTGLADLTGKVAKAKGVDPAMMALPLLAVAGAALGNTRRVELKPGWREPAIVWGVVVADSGTGKSPAFRFAVEPLQQEQTEALRQHDDALAEYEAERLKHERDMQQWRQTKSETPAPEAPVKPSAKRSIVSDTTIEGLAPLQSENPRGLLIARDELAGWFGSFDRYAGKGGSDAAAYLSMFNSEPFIIDRKGAAKSLSVEHSAAWVIGGIQPSIFANHVSGEHAESGLLARLLIVAPPKQVALWAEDGVSGCDKMRWRDIVSKLRSLDAECGDDWQPFSLPLSDGAKQVFVEFYNRVEHRLAESSGMVAAMLSKIRAYAARLALIHEYVQWAESGGPEPTEVGVDAMQAGVVLADWFAHEAQRVYAGTLGGAANREQAELLQWIAGRGGSVSPRDLVRGLSRFRGDAEAAKTALEELAGAGLGESEYITPESGGRSSLRFTIGGGAGDNRCPERPETGRSSIVGGVAVGGGA